MLTHLADTLTWMGTVLLVAVGLSGFYGVLCVIGQTVSAFWDEVAK